MHYHHVETELRHPTFESLTDELQITPFDIKSIQISDATATKTRKERLVPDGYIYIERVRLRSGERTRENIKASWRYA